ncbi:MAP3K epsilon protein kinase [Planoprotostelium fungivorum]|uniref:non-specific serine/threonine protein kinase n=1 Tax=Planoprotostelium fungivorum TaxID=1890364 RepID=A0A2P6NTN1_9EUKA|nr:MAP3K epsilon protein kinase [Planoprotostelium fungivorum]
MQGLARAAKRKDNSPFKSPVLENSKPSESVKDPVAYPPSSPIKDTAHDGPNPAEFKKMLSLSSEAQRKGSANKKKHIEKYKLGDQLGKGAYSTVYKALNVENGQFVAIKRMKRRKQGEDALKMEISLLKTFAHTNIVRYIDVIVSESHINLVLEYVDSGSLSAVLEEYGIFPEPLVSIYIEQVLNGLSYLHEHSIIHRDIKGPNLLITKEGVIKLADFGIAMTSFVVSEDSSKFPGGAVVEGSPFWMAPETISEPSRATVKSDIWSLACTILELITGFPPYFDNSGITALYRMVNDARPPFPDDISPELTDFLTKCFNKDANRRPSAKELLAHSWITKHNKTPESYNLNDTLRRVQKYNTAKREQVIRNIQNVASMDWTQITSQNPQSNNSAAASQRRGTPTHNPPQPTIRKIQSDRRLTGADRLSNDWVAISSPSTPTLPSKHEVDANRDALSLGHKALLTKETSSAPVTLRKLDTEPLTAHAVATEARRNFLFYYTVYKIKVTHGSREWYVFRSMSDFTDQETKLKRANVAGLPDLPKLKKYGGSDTEYVEYMMHRIDEYLKAVMNMKETHKSMLPFLSFEAINE